jgi:hypothetical protein
MYGIKVYMRGQPPEWFMVNPDRDSYRRPARFSTIDDAFEASLIIASLESDATFEGTCCLPIE